MATTSKNQIEWFPNKTVFNSYSELTKNTYECQCSRVTWPIRCQNGASLYCSDSWDLNFAKRVSVILYKMWSSFRLLWCAITQVWFNWRFSSCSTAMLWIVHFQILTCNNWYSHTKSLNPLTEKYNLSLFDKFHSSELSISIPIGMLF